MKIIFLDIDGVLNTHKSIGRFGFDFIDHILVALVARIVQETQAKVVLSSTWRIDKKDRELALRALQEQDLEIHDFTPVLVGEDRHVEIQAWLDKNQVERFAILDDDPDAKIEGNFFRTDESLGLTVEIAERVIKHLAS
jgi:hypothetical protein